MRNLFFAILVSLLSLGCAQTIDLRASHFAVPVVSAENWNPQLHGSFTANTTISLLSDYTTNPPVEGEVGINQDADVVDYLLPAIKNIGMDASLSLKWGLEAFLHGSKVGLRWQFLNHGQGTDHVVAALHVSSGSYSEGNSQSSGGSESKVDSTVSTGQTGMSIGYTFSNIVPYFSYIRETHSVTTEVTNSGGAFGPYKDSGEHIYYTIGITSPLQQGFVYSLEISGIDIQWNNPTVNGWQNAAGFRLGYSW